MYFFGDGEEETYNVVASLLVRDPCAWSSCFVGGCLLHAVGFEVSGLFD
jgi:hypothetical protein